MAGEYADGSSDECVWHVGTRGHREGVQGVQACASHVEFAFVPLKPLQDRVLQDQEGGSGHAGILQNGDASPPPSSARAGCLLR